MPWDGELDKKETRLLSELGDEPRGFIGCDASSKVEYDSLSAKECVVVGQNIVGTIWAGEPKPEMRPVINGSVYMVRITDRGREKLAKLDAKKAADICGND